MSRHNSSNVFRIQPITVKRAKTIRAHQENARNTSCFMSKAGYRWMGENVTEHFRTYKINTKGSGWFCKVMLYLSQGKLLLPVTNSSFF